VLRRHLLAALVVGLSAATVHADCVILSAEHVMSEPSIELVFAGRVVDIVHVADAVSRATFDVDGVWKGTVPRRIDLYVSEFNAEKPHFTKGADYVALAVRMKDPSLRRAAGLPSTDTPTEYLAMNCSDELQNGLARQLGPSHSRREDSLRVQALAHGGEAAVHMNDHAAPWSVSELSRHAEVVIHGRVTGVRAHLTPDEGFVVTDVTIAPIRVLKQTAPRVTQPIVVRHLGGTVLEGRLKMSTFINLFPEEERLVAGEEVICFLAYKASDRVFELVDGPLAVFRVRQGQVQGMKNDNGRFSASETLQPLAAFLADVNHQLRTGR
jgi:hypothetical protein